MSVLPRRNKKTKLKCIKAHKPPKYTQWVALGNYSFSGDDFITFVRKNNKTGMLFFKTKKVNGYTNARTFLGSGMINTQEVWDRLHAINVEVKLDGRDLEAIIKDMKR